MARPHRRPMSKRPDCYELTLPLRPSDMKKGQSMVKYTFLFIKVILPEFVYYLGEIWVLCVRNG